jgi:hypothetical protein
LFSFACTLVIQQSSSLGKLPFSLWSCGHMSAGTLHPGERASQVRFFKTFSRICKLELNKGSWLETCEPGSADGLLLAGVGGVL